MAVNLTKTRKIFLLVVLSLGCLYLLFFYINVKHVKLIFQFVHGNGNPPICAENISHCESLSHSPTTIDTSSQVLIVAFGRSGSSFLGGIFNSHPDIFFIFEPLHHLHKIVDRNSKYLHQVGHVVHSFLNCNFKDDAFLKQLSSFRIWRTRNRPLVSPPFCQTTHEIATNFVPSKHRKLCNRSISVNALNNMCSKYKYSAAKILLECLHPANITWLVNIASLPVNVLYLVRDPRAMFHSRNSLGWVVPRKHFKESLENGEVEARVKKVCDAMELNLGAVLLRPQTIKLIRYEEISRNPKMIARDLFSQFRIPMTNDVLRWIDDKTHQPAKISSFSLSRQADVTLHSWRKKIDHQFLQIIETRCARVMEYLGYIRTNGSRSMLNNLSRPLHLEKMRDLKETYQWRDLK